MLCSIVIPLFNKAAYVESALQSILSQRYQQFEVIVVDDGSSDDGPERVARIMDQRIQLVRQSNQGVSAARNFGIAGARGDLVCFLDADDCYLPSYLDTIVRMARTCSNADYFATGYRRFSDGDFLVSPASPISESETNCTVQIIDDCYEHRRLCGATFFTGSVAVRRQALSRLQPCFAPGESMGEDLDLWFRLGERSPLAYCAAPLVGYRVGMQDSLSASQPVRHLLPAWKRLEARAVRQLAPRTKRRSMLRLVAHERMMLARGALSEGRRKDAFVQLLAGWRGMSSRRWWLTLALALFGPTAAVRHWINWRSARADNR